MGSPLTTSTSPDRRTGPAYLVTKTGRPKQRGWLLTQRGNYGDASGEYAYIDARHDLKVDIELLESFVSKPEQKD